MQIVEEHEEVEVVGTLALVFSFVAFYAKSVLGVFMIGAMNELAIKLMQAAVVIANRDAKRLLKKNETHSCMLALLYIVVGIFDCWNTITIPDGIDAVRPKWRFFFVLVLPPIVLISISIALSCTVFNLLTQIKRHFNRQVLMDEEWRVKMIFLVFTVTYMTRAIFYVTMDLITNFSNDLTADFGADTALVYYVLYNVWDVMPLTLIMQYHRKCYAGQLRSQREYDEYQTTTASSRDDSQDPETNFTESEVVPESLPKSTVDTPDSNFYNESILKQRDADMKA